MERKIHIEKIINAPEKERQRTIIIKKHRKVRFQL